MGLFNRIFKIGEAEANSLVDKLEDPIKLTEQGIRDLKTDLDKALQALAEVKAMAIRSRKEAADYKSKSKDYEQKAIMLVQRSSSGQMEAAEADRLAGEALVRKEDSEQQATRCDNDVKKFDASIATLDSNIKKLQSSISSYENELKTLKARAMVSAATKNVNKQLAGIDSSSTVAMLEKMKQKVDKDESLAEAYGDIANESKSVDDEINKALAGSTPSKGADALAALKAKLAIQNP